MTLVNETTDLFEQGFPYSVDVSFHLYLPNHRPFQQMRLHVTLPQLKILTHLTFPGYNKNINALFN